LAKGAFDVHCIVRGVGDSFCLSCDSRSCNRNSIRMHRGVCGTAHVGTRDLREFPIRSEKFGIEKDPTAVWDETPARGTRPSTWEKTLESPENRLDDRLAVWDPVNWPTMPPVLYFWDFGWNPVKGGRGSVKVGPISDSLALAVASGEVRSFLFRLLAAASMVFCIVTRYVTRYFRSSALSNPATCQSQFPMIARMTYNREGPRGAGPSSPCWCFDWRTSRGACRPLPGGACDTCESDPRTTYLLSAPRSVPFLN